jgi:hypothetical protein
MTKRELIGCAVLSAMATLLAAPEPAWNAAAIKECDRACLIGILDSYVNAVFTRNPQAVPPLAGWTPGSGR